MTEWIRRQWIQSMITIMICAVILIAPIAAVAKEAGKYTELDEVIDLLQTFHLSGITEAQLIQYAIEGIIWELDDPYTEYLSPTELDGFMNDLNYVYEGTGIVLDESEGEYVVSTVFDGSSAQQQGLIEGDIITSINGTAISDESYYDLFDVQFGEYGSSVSVTVTRDGKSIELELDYSDIQVPTVTALLVGEGTGYIRLSTFSDEAVDQFAVALATLRAQGLQQLILDVRDNSGGLIDAVQKIAGHFLKAGPLAYLEDRNGREEIVNIIAQEESVSRLPLVILTNEWSASASETLVGALQDYEAGVVIGEQTYGKGAVQKIYPLYTTGGSLKVTVQHYLTPNRNVVHEVGITPDILVSGGYEQLLRAFYELKVKELTFELRRTKVIVNGIEATGTVDMIRDDKKLLLPIRFLVTAIGAELTWDGKTKEVVIKANGQTVKYPQSSLKMKENSSYIDIARFSIDFPQVKWNSSVTAPKIDVINESNS